jgi:hypothetical protein
VCLADPFASVMPLVAGLGKGKGVGKLVGEIINSIFTTDPMFDAKYN